MVDHPGTEYDIERLVGKGESLDHPKLEVNGGACFPRFAAGPSDQFPPWVNPHHPVQPPPPPFWQPAPAFRSRTPRPARFLLFEAEPGRQTRAEVPVHGLP